MRNSLRFVCLAAAVFSVAIAGCKSGNDHERTAVPEDAKIEQADGAKPGANVHIAAGDLAVAQGNAAEAIKQYEKAIEMEPNGKVALYKLAALDTYNGQFDIAIATWQHYVDATNQSANGYVNLGRANELAGKWKDAEVAYLRAINRESLNKAARVNYGILLAKRDRTDEAQVQLAKVLQPAEVEYNLGSVYELRKDYEAATAAYNRALALDANFSPARQRLAMMKGVTSAQ